MQSLRAIAFAAAKGCRTCPCDPVYVICARKAPGGPRHGDCQRFEVRYTFANSEVPHDSSRLRRFRVAAAGAASVTFAQLPKFDTAPGKWSYNTRTEIPGMGSIPMSFEQCVTQKDIDEGRNLNSQKEAGMDCKYQDVKVTGNRYQFTAVCTGKNLPSRW